MTGIPSGSSRLKKNQGHCSGEVVMQRRRRFWSKKKPTRNGTEPKLIPVCECDVPPWEECQHTRPFDWELEVTVEQWNWLKQIQSS